jgi:hypothetical protein
MKNSSSVKYKATVNARRRFLRETILTVVGASFEINLGAKLSISAKPIPWNFLVIKTALSYCG